MAMDTRPLPQDPSLPPVPELEPSQSADGVLSQLRTQIRDIDQALVEAINQRLDLVAQIKRLKAGHGLPFVDADREASMLSHVSQVNRGPLSGQGLREIYVEILDLMRREMAR